MEGRVEQLLLLFGNVQQNLQSIFTCIHQRFHMTYFGSILFFSFLWKTTTEKVLKLKEKGKKMLCPLENCFSVPVSCVHFPVVKEEKKTWAEFFSSGQWDLRSGSAACNVLKKLYSPLAPAQHVLDSTTSRFLSQRIKPWFFFAHSARGLPARSKNSSCRQAIQKSYEKKKKKNINYSSLLKLKWSFLTFIRIYLLIFHLSSHSSHFRFDRALPGSRLEEWKKKKRERN